MRLGKPLSWTPVRRDAYRSHHCLNCDLGPCRPIDPPTQISVCAAGSMPGKFCLGEEVGCSGSTSQGFNRSPREFPLSYEAAEMRAEYSHQGHKWTLDGR